MKDILSRILQKRGLSSVDELDKDEKQTFQEWQAVLTKDELSTQDIRNFCQSQISVVEGKWADLNTSNEKKAEMIPYHTVYKLLLSAIDSPKASLEALEKNLIQLIQ